MTDAELDALQVLCDQATQGPWSRGIAGFAGVVRFDGDDVHPVCAIVDQATADFIAATREALPALIAEVRRLRDGWHAAVTEYAIHLYGPEHVWDTNEEMRREADDEGADLSHSPATDGISITLRYRCFGCGGPMAATNLVELGDDRMVMLCDSCVAGRARTWSDDEGS